MICRSRRLRCAGALLCGIDKNLSPADKVLSSPSICQAAEGPGAEFHSTSGSVRSRIRYRLSTDIHHLMEQGLRYPIARAPRIESLTDAQRRDAIARIAATPGN